MKKGIIVLLAALLLLTAPLCAFAEDATPAPIDLTIDREGNPITLPENIERIISMGPSNTEIITALGFGDKIVASDEYSAGIEGLPEDIPLFSMMEPDGERIISLNPDVIFITGMSKVEGEDPLKIVASTGICVIYLPSSSSIDGIKDDIRYIAAALGVEETGGEIISALETELEAVRTVGEAITDKKKVYFEISAAPYIYSFGTGVFLDEIIGLIGAENILADQESWISLSDEAVVSANPDVILTSVNYIEDPVGEIIARAGWNEITAVKNGEVYYIDTDSSNRPSQNIIKALREMAYSVYPELYPDYAPIEITDEEAPGGETPIEETPAQ